MRKALLLLALLASPVLSQQTIMEQDPITASSLTPDNRGDVYMIVDDDNQSPAETARIDLKVLAQMGGYSFRTAGPSTTLTGNEPFLIFVDPSGLTDTVTVPDNMSCIIHNVSEDGSTITVDVTESASIFIRPGEYAYCIWSETLAPFPGHLIYKRYALDAINASNDMVTSNAVKTYVDGQTWLTIDATIQNSTNPVENQAVDAEFDRRSIVQPGDVVIVGSGVAVTDDTNLDAAVLALNAAGQGTLWIKGEILLSDEYKFEHPINLRGLDDTAAIAPQNVSGRFTWNPAGSTDWIPMSTGLGDSEAVNAIGAGESEFTSPNLAFSPGEWFCVWSEDAVANVDPHSGLPSNVLELHQVQDDDKGSDVYSIHDHFADAMSTNQRIVKVPLLTKDGEADNSSNLYVGGFTIRQHSDTQNPLILHFKCLAGVTVRDIIYELNDDFGAAGQMQFDICANIAIDNVTCQGLDDYNLSVNSRYLIELLTVNDVTITNCRFHRIRHAIDSSWTFSDTERYGGAFNVTVANCSFTTNGNSAGVIEAGGPFSTHNSAYQWLVTGCHFTGGNENGGAGSKMAIARGRHIEFNSCLFEGADQNTAFASRGLELLGYKNSAIGCIFRRQEHGVTLGVAGLLANDFAVVQGCTFEGGVVDSDYQLKIVCGDNHVIAHNVFMNNLGGAIRVADTQDTDGVIIDKNTFTASPIAATGNTTAVIFAESTGINDTTNYRITSNSFIDCPEVCIVDLSDERAGDWYIADNTMYNSGNTNLCEHTGHANNVITYQNNAMSDNSLVTVSVDFGANVDANTTLEGNTLTGWGTTPATSLGLAGTDAANIATTDSALNWIR